MVLIVEVTVITNIWMIIVMAEKLGKLQSSEIHSTQSCFNILFLLIEV